jgi:hypothetical protein
MVVLRCATVSSLAGSDVAELSLTLTRLWSEVLAVEAPVDGDFFALGGNSMLGVELTFLIAAEIGEKVPVKLLIDSPTPQAMAEAIRRRAQTRAGDGG